MPSLPPGPTSRLRETIHLATRPYAHFRTLRQRYGDPVTVDTLNGLIVFTGDPEGVKEIFLADGTTFAPYAPDTLGPLVGKRSIFLLAAEAHRRERALLSPPFRGDTMRAFSGLMREAAEKEVGRWQRGAVVDIHRSANRVSMEVLFRAVFGTRDDQRVEEMRTIASRAIEEFNPLLVFLPALQRAYFPPWKRFQANLSAVDAALYEEIAARRADDSGEDILSGLTRATYEDGSRMSNKALRDELFTMLLAGHETTAIAISWAMDWLHRDAQALVRVKEELGGEAPESELPYLAAVCQESLRLNPIIPDAPRVLAKPLRLRGYTLPPGVAVSAAAPLTHMDPTLFPAPEQFLPERFLHRKYTPYEYYPFGGGHRRCIGSAFAIQEMKIVLSTFLRAGRFASVGPPPTVVRRNITMGPRTVKLRWEG